MVQILTKYYFKIITQNAAKSLYVLKIFPPPTILITLFNFTLGLLLF